MKKESEEVAVIPVEHHLETGIYLCYQEAFPGKPISLEKFRQIYFSHLSYDARFSFVSKQEQQITAFLLARPLSDNSLYIMLCGVRSDQQRNGIMSHLVHLMEEQAGHFGTLPICLDIDRSNQPAIAAFRKWHYIDSGVIANYRYNGETAGNDYRLEQRMEKHEIELNEFDRSFTEGFSYFDLISPQNQILGSVILDEVRSQIVYFTIYHPFRGEGYCRALISRVVMDTGCRYVFRVADPELKSFLSKVGFEVILEQIVFSKK